MINSPTFGSLRDGSVKPVPIKFVTTVVEAYGYMGRMPGFVSHAFGLFWDDVCGGIEVFGSPTGRYTAMFPDRKVIQIKRGFCFPGTPHSGGSFLISRCLTWLKNNTDFDVVVGYSNPLDGEIGNIYQASNFAYMGFTANGPSFVVDGTRRNARVLKDCHGTTSPAKLQAIYGDRLVVHPGVSSKHLYAYSLRKDLIIQSQPYPKREQIAK